MSAPRVRVSTSILAAASAFAALVLYSPVLIGLARQWSEDDDAAYGAVVAVAAALMFRRRISRARVLPFHGSRWGMGLLLCACALFVVGTLAADVFLVRLSLPVFAAGAIGFVGGLAHLRVFAAPLALCVVAIPLPSAVVTELTMPLQLLASRCAAGMLGLVGVPVVRDGNVLTLDYITLQVAQACSGMRSIVTLLALVAVYGAVRELPVRRVMLLAAVTIPIALVGNGLRVAFTALLASRLGEAATRGVVHDATGWVAFVLMCAALLAVDAGVRSGSDRGQIGVRPWCDPGPTRVRPRSERGQSSDVGRLKLRGRRT